MATLPIVEHFLSIQGEGLYQGTASYFIRTAGCEVGCHWCDTKNSWDQQKHPHLPVDFLADEAAKSKVSRVVVTGGEPLQHDLNALTRALKKRSLATHIETSGGYPLTGSWQWICVSPKKFKAPRTDLLQKANELKVVIYHPSDVLWAEENRKQISETCALFLQPEWSRRKKIMPILANYVKKNPQWRVSLQNHKILNVP